MAGLSTNEKRTKTYNVGIPKLISFDIAVSRTRKSDKRMASAISSNNNDDECVEPEAQRPVVSSGSDDQMHSANHTATHSDSVEMIDHDENLRSLPLMLHKLATIDTVSPQASHFATAPRAFIRSPEISPRRRASERPNRKAPTLGSNRVTSRTTPSSPITSPLASPRGSMVVIPDEIILTTNDTVSPSSSIDRITTLKPRKPVVLAAMPSPRQSLYDSAISHRRVRDFSIPVKERTMCHSNSSADCTTTQRQELITSTMRMYANEEEEDVKSMRAFLQRTVTQQHRELDGFITELKEYTDSVGTVENTREEEVVIYDDLDKSITEEEEEAEIKEEEESESVRPLERVYLYQVQNQGDLMPDYEINHEAVVRHGTGVLNLRQERYVKDQPITNFCFHCDRVLIYSQVNHHRALTGHASDILYGVVRCRIFRDINLCKQCYDTLDLDEVIQIKPKAMRIFRPIYFAK